MGFEELGYKFLGWQNSWDYVSLDKDGKVTTDMRKAWRIGYTKEQQPEYMACEEQKHKIKYRHMNNRGTENIGYCEVCRIYWKFDSSD